jgi:transposase
MRGPYPGDLRIRVIQFVEAGASRRDAAEHFEVSASSAIRWLQRFHEDGTFEPMPRGGGTSFRWRSIRSRFSTLSASNGTLR